MSIIIGNKFPDREFAIILISCKSIKSDFIVNFLMPDIL